MAYMRPTAKFVARPQRPTPPWREVRPIPRPRGSVADLAAAEPSSPSPSFAQVVASVKAARAKGQHSDAADQARFISSRQTRPPVVRSTIGKRPALPSTSRASSRPALATTLRPSAIPQRNWNSDFVGTANPARASDTFEWEESSAFEDQDPLQVLAADGLTGEGTHVRTPATNLLPTELDSMGVPVSLTFFELQPHETVTDSGPRARLCDAVESALTAIERALDPYAAVPSAVWAWDGYESNPCRAVTNQKPCQSRKPKTNPRNHSYARASGG